MFLLVIYLPFPVGCLSKFFPHFKKLKKICLTLSKYYRTGGKGKGREGRTMKKLDRHKESAGKADLHWEKERGCLPTSELQFEWLHQGGRR